MWATREFFLTGFLIWDFLRFRILWNLRHALVVGVVAKVWGCLWGIREWWRREICLDPVRRYVFHKTLAQADGKLTLSSHDPP